MNHKIDNAADGNCGFYAYAIGLIHIIQTEYQANRSSKTFEKWQSLGLDAVRLQQLLEFDLKKMRMQPRVYKKGLLLELQESLRHMACQKSQDELMLAIERDDLNTSTLYGKFNELVNFYLKDSPSSAELTQIRGFNELALDKSVLQLAKQVASNFKANLEVMGLKLEGLSVNEGLELQKQLVQNAMKESLSVVLAGTTAMLDRSHWATASELGDLANLFETNLNIVGHNLGRPVEGWSTICLENEGNRHWFTKVPSFPALTLSVAEKEQVKQIVRDNTKHLEVFSPVDSYKAHLKTLLEGTLSKGLFHHVKNKIDVDKLDEVIVAENHESDEEFAERIQEAEVRRVLR